MGESTQTREHGVHQDGQRFLLSSRGKGRRGGGSNAVGESSDPSFVSERLGERGRARDGAGTEAQDFARRVKYPAMYVINAKDPLAPLGELQRKVCERMGKNAQFKEIAL